MLNQIYASLSALKEAGWQELNLLLTRNANEVNAFFAMNCPLLLKLKVNGIEEELIPCKM